MTDAAELTRLVAALVGGAAARPLPPTSITEAALRDDPEAIDAFLDGGADIEERTVGFASPLAAAAGRGNLAAVERLLARGACLEPPGAVFPLLAFAIANRRLDVVERVLAAGASPAPYRNHFRNAVKQRQWDVVDALLAGGVDPGWLEPSEAAELAGFVERENPRSPEYRARLREQQRAAWAAASFVKRPEPLPDEERERIENEAVERVRGDRSLAAAKTSKGTPILSLAVDAGATRLVEALLAAGADPDPRKGGASPLSRAAARGDERLVARLLEAGADPNGSGPDSPHPLVAAAKSGSLSTVERLLAAGSGLLARERREALPAACGPAAKRMRELLEKAPAPKRGGAKKEAPAAPSRRSAR